MSGTANRDDFVVDRFGDEWSRFDQSELPAHERQQLFDDYFSIFPWATLPPQACGLDLGCGSGRWATLVSERVGHLLCVDASPAAAAVAARNLAGRLNCQVEVASVEALPVTDETLDFAYSLGVLHHVPDTLAGLRSLVRTVKSGAPVLIYLYYALDNRPAWFRLLWRISNALRQLISRSPKQTRVIICQVIALLCYWPLARFARLAELAGRDASAFPLAFYRRRSLYTMRTDALDRFGTRLEQRYTRDQIAAMMAAAGLVDTTFRDAPPYWVAVGRRA